MSVCCCSMAGTAACQHCSANPFATDVWTNKTVMVDHIEAKPFGNGLDVCPVCGKPSTIGKPQTNADRIRAMSDEELAEEIIDCVLADLFRLNVLGIRPNTKEEWLEWLKEDVKDGET